MIFYKMGIKKINYSKYFLIFIQIIVRFIFQPYLFFKSKYKKNNIKLEKGKKYIFIANHISKIDSFLICSSLNFRTLIKILPFKFMVTKVYMDKIGKIIKLIGCYSAHKEDEFGKSKHNLELSKDFLDNGECVFIFPEGGIWKQKFGVGAFLLNQRVKNSELLLFGIKKNVKIEIDFLGKKNINEYNDKKDLLEIGKQIFTKIEKWTGKKSKSY